jgi:hypothetical protein
MNWRPYDSVWDLLSARVHTDEPYWRARVPMIYFWMVCWDYPDRVMKQLGLFQTVPPPDPHHWMELQKLNKIIHTNRT